MLKYVISSVFSKQTRFLIACLPTAIFAISCSKAKFNNGSNSNNQSETGKSSNSNSEISDEKITKIEAIEGVNPLSGWHCQIHKDALPHELNLQNFSPTYKGGYSIYIRPPTTHCTGTQVELKILGKISGRIVEIPCNGEACLEGKFNYAVASKNVFRVSSDDLKDLMGDDDGLMDFALSYKWLKNSGGSGATCPGESKSSYGIGIFIAQGEGVATSDVAPGYSCEKFDIDK